MLIRLDGSALERPLDAPSAAKPLSAARLCGAGRGAVDKGGRRDGAGSGVRVARATAGIDCDLIESLAPRWLVNLITAEHVTDLRRCRTADHYFLAAYYGSVLHSRMWRGRGGALRSAA
jgi:hypothetical protein